MKQNLQRNSKQNKQNSQQYSKTSPVGDFEYNMSTAQLGLWLGLRAKLGNKGVSGSTHI